MAVSNKAIHIYSNDGTTILYTYFLSGAAIVTGKGIKDNDYVFWEYSGDITFKGFATSANATKVDYKEGDTVSLVDGANYLYIVESLEGTTWYVPSGWNSSDTPDGYIDFDVIGSLVCGSQTYTVSRFWSASTNIIYISSIDYPKIYNTQSFTLTITGGDDATNTKLISWLSKYGELQSSEQTPKFKFTRLYIGKEVASNGYFRLLKLTTEKPIEMQTFKLYNGDELVYEATMPKGYSFYDFIGSEYDTTDGKMSIDKANMVQWVHSVEPVKIVSIENADGEAMIRTNIASGKFYYSYVIADTQTLTIVNENNESETVSFTMPSGYTFEQFIGSEYDTSGGKFSFATESYEVMYNDSPLHRLNEIFIYITDIASGTFYYEGESATQTLTVINSNNPSETETFTMPIGYTFYDFIGSEYDTSGGKFTLSEPTSPATHRTVFYDGYSIGVFEFEAASGTFYYEGEADTYTIEAGTYVFNEDIVNPNDIEVGIYDANTYELGEGSYYDGSTDTLYREQTIRYIDFYKGGGLCITFNEGFQTTEASRTNWWCILPDRNGDRVLFYYPTGENLIACRTIKIFKDITVDKDFYDLFMLNTTRTTQILTIVPRTEYQITETFEMPYGYTFEDLVSSKYNTDKILTHDNTLVYVWERLNGDSNYLYYDAELKEQVILDTSETVYARGTFYVESTSHVGSGN